MSGAAIAIIVVVACAAFYVVTRGKRTHPTGAFRNRPSKGGGVDADGADGGDSSDGGDGGNGGE
jgi:hypothetical protein